MINLISVNDTDAGKVASLKEGFLETHRKPEDFTGSDLDWMKLVTKRFVLDSAKDGINLKREREAREAAIAAAIPIDEKILT